MLDYLVGQVPLPDFLLRSGVKYLLSGKKKEVQEQFKRDSEKSKETLQSFASELKTMPIAILTDKANEQHYEVPTKFYQLVLGKHLKYSCSSWNKAQNLDEAEVEMLDTYIERAQIKSGQTILDMGCGWGSFSLYAAQKFPDSTFIAVSNSVTQKKFIDQKAKDFGLNNLQVITEDIAKFDYKANTFDRVVSVEMLEHVKNYQALFEKVSSWLKPDGKVFVHIFTHNKGAYHFEVKDQTDWMSKYFFSGGMMPADELFYFFQDHLNIKDHWRVNGSHYQKTSAAWLQNMDDHKDEILGLFMQTYGAEEAMKWFRYWRIFFMACEELWGFDSGNEWIVSHYLFENKKH